MSTWPPHRAHRAREREERRQREARQAAQRAAALGDGTVYDAIAIDGPIVPDATIVAARHCERVLARGAFGKRCKAGFSHFGDSVPRLLDTALLTLAAR